MITGVHIDQIGFDSTDPDETDMAILTVMTNSAVTYCIEAMFDIDPNQWQLAWAEINEGLIGVNEFLENLDIPLDYLDDQEGHFISNLLNAPVLSWVWN